MTTNKDALDECREAFERYITHDGNYPHMKYKNFGGAYLHEDACIKWDAWKASWNTRAALTPPVVDVEALKRETVKTFLVDVRPDNTQEDRIRRITIQDTIDHLHAQGYLNAKPLNWRELLIQSETTFCKNFGYDAMAQWVYKDLEELFEAAQEGGKDD